jgi:hypothetical protein
LVFVAIGRIWTSRAGELFIDVFFEEETWENQFLAATNFWERESGNCIRIIKYYW